MMSTNNDQELWMEIIREEESRFFKILSLWKDVESKDQVLRESLATVRKRGTSLRLLLLLDNQVRLSLLEDLLDVASVGHADIGLCRRVIMSIPRDQLRPQLRNIIPGMLASAGEDEEIWRRLAELLYEVDEGLLKELVESARNSPNPDVREVASDYHLVLSQGPDS